MTQEEWTARFIAKYCEGDSSTEHAERAKIAAHNLYLGGLRDIVPETAAGIGGEVAQQSRESWALKLSRALIQKVRGALPR
jgi:hypothetical protein